MLEEDANSATRTKVPHNPTNNAKNYDLQRVANALRMRFNAIESPASPLVHQYDKKRFATTGIKFV